MVFGEAFERIKKGSRGMRLPHWKPDVLIRVQWPDEHSKMSAPYLYVDSRNGRVPWKETMIELFSKDWEVEYPQGVPHGTPNERLNVEIKDYE